MNNWAGRGGVREQARENFKISFKIVLDEVFSVNIYIAVPFVYDVMRVCILTMVDEDILSC